MSVGTRSRTSSRGLCSVTDCPICCPPSPHRSSPELSQLPSRAMASQWARSRLSTRTKPLQPLLGGPGAPRPPQKTHTKLVSGPLVARRAGAGPSAPPGGRAIQGEDLLEMRGGTLVASTEMGVLWLSGDHRGRTMGRQSPGLQGGQCGQPELPTCLCLALMGRQKEVRPQGRGPCVAEDLGVHIGCTRTSWLSARAVGAAAC